MIFDVDLLQFIAYFEVALGSHLLCTVLQSRIITLWLETVLLLFTFKKNKSVLKFSLNQLEKIEKK